jgi:hypothetical protein
LDWLISTDPVYKILKLLEEEKELHFLQVGIDERDFNIAVRHIYEAGYANADSLTQPGVDYITGYERRIKSN